MKSTLTFDLNAMEVYMEVPNEIRDANVLAVQSQHGSARMTGDAVSARSEPASA